MLFFLIPCLMLISSNNIDTQSPLIIRGPEDPGSLFGYSVLLHEVGGSSMALVGAPRGNTQQPLERPGAVYRCPLVFGDTKQRSDCDTWIYEFDSDGDTNITVEDGYGESITKVRETKSHQYFSISLVRTGQEVIACAHLYKDHYKVKIHRTDKELPIGRCIRLSRDLDQQHGVISPCLNVADLHDTYGACLAGTSITTAGDSVVVVGAPNSNYGRGNAFLFNATSDQTLEMRVESLIKASLRHEVDYAGYSSVFCDVTGDGEKELILGTPRAYNYRGTFRVYFGNKLKSDDMMKSYGVYEEDDDDREHFKKIDVLCPSGLFNCDVPRGDHMGSYFGHSLACADLNNDGFDDLVVSSPFFTERIPGSILLDMGKTIIYFGEKAEYGIPDFASRRQTVITGDQIPSSLFGYSLNTDADLNADGITDLIVGAPYQNDEGAVYVYNGGDGHFDPTPSQKITGRDLDEPDLTTFGMSLSSGINIDGKGGDDLLIGTLKSNRVVGLRTFPIVDIKPILLLKYDVIDLDAANYEDEATGEMVVGNTLRLNITTYGVTFKSQPILTYKLFLDTEIDEDTEKRAYFRLNKTSKMQYSVQDSVKLASNAINEALHMYTILIKRDQIRNVHDLYVGITGYINSGTKFSDKLALKHERFREAKKLIKIDTHCNRITGICQSDMAVVSIKVVSTDHYTSLIIGQAQRIKVVVGIRNNGPEDAHRVSMTLAVPASHSLLSKIKSPSGTRCKQDGIYNRFTCVFHKPVPPATKTSEPYYFEFLFSVNASLLVPNKQELYNATVEVDIPSMDENEENNNAAETLNTKYLADLRVLGAARLKRIKFNNNIPYEEKMTLAHLGPDVRHIVEVRIDEDSTKDTIQDIRMELRYPSPALYLYDIRIPDSHRYNIRCNGKVDIFKLFPNATISETQLKYYEQNNNYEDYLFGIGEGKRKVSIDCETGASCTIINCTVGQLERGAYDKAYVRFEIFGRLKQFKFRDIDEVSVTTFVEVLSAGAGLLLPPKEYIIKRITTRLLASHKDKSQKIHILIIVFSVMAGLVILGLIILVLFKKGFFKTSTQIHTPPDFFQTGHRSETLTRDEYNAT